MPTFVLVCFYELGSLNPGSVKGMEEGKYFLFYTCGAEAVQHFFMVTDVYFGNDCRFSIVLWPALATFYPIPDGGYFSLKQFYNLKKRVLGKIYSNHHGFPLAGVDLKFVKKAIRYPQNNCATITLLMILFYQSLLQSIGFRAEESI